jgi:two-component system sensor histidine kinase BaeS
VTDEPSRLELLVHEVRSPVAALRAIAQVVAVDDPDPSQLGQFVALVVAACRGIDRLLSDVAVASIALEDVDPGRLVVEAAAAAQVAGARVRAAVARELPRLRADPLRLRQALDNLVANALAHSHVDDEVVLTAEADGAAVVLSVRDSGQGIRPQDQARIFDAGVRLDPSVEGAGLGLAIARAIVEAHGGALRVDSAPGEGATFTIALPAPDRR